MIKRNRAKCKNCGDVIESFHVHDWVCCKCFAAVKDTKGIFIDGGKDYIRIGGELSNYISMVEYEEDTNVRT